MRLTQDSVHRKIDDVRLEINTCRMRIVRAFYIAEITLESL